MDIHNTFLHSDLLEEVYIRPPPGFRTLDSRQVCRLNKSFYGLCQTPRCWFSKLTASLCTYVFTQSYNDYSLFTYAKNGVFLCILIYVDDLLIFGNNAASIAKFKVYLNSCFQMKNLGFLKYFLGIEIARNSSRFYLCQQKYALEIIPEADLLGSKLASSPLEPNHKLALATDPLFPYLDQYHRLIGKLIYLIVYLFYKFVLNLLIFT